MWIYPYITVFTYLLTIIKANADHHVYLRIQEENHTHCYMPTNLKITLDFRDPKKPQITTLNLDLIKNKNVHANVPLYVIEGRHGAHKISKSRSPFIHGHGVYQSPTHGGYFTVDCRRERNVPNNIYTIKGSLYLKKQKFRLEHSLEGVHVVHNVNINNYKQYIYKLTPEEDTHSYDFKLTQRKRREISKLKSKSREKRNVINEIFIDILVVTDHAIYREWLSTDNNVDEKAKEDIKRYFSHVMNGVSSRYKSLESTFKVTIRLVGIIIAETAEAAPWTELHKENVSLKYQVDADTVLEALKKWVVNTSSVPEHDHVMLFTGYDLFGNDNGFRFNYTTGLAYIGTMCQGEGRSVSIVEDHGGFQSVGTATHEIGHSLGADHDGTNNTCSSNDRYIMAGQSFNETKYNAYNPWTFSRCSIDYFTNYVNSISDSIEQRQCLIYKIPVDRSLPDVSDEMPGQEFGPDQQCRNIYGNTSYLCRGSSFGDSDSVCKAMFCRNPLTTRKCVLHSAAEGTSCGDKKWCSQGHCLYSDRAPARKEGCTFGDQTGLIFSGKTCSKLLEESLGYCYIKSFWDRCCQSCYKYHTGVNGCEFGDKVLHCKVSNCGETVANGTLYDKDCCGTCKYQHTSPTTTTTVATATARTCNDVDSINNVSCSDFLKLKGRRQCYRSEVYEACCQSCNKVQHGLKECTYGDKVLGCDPDNCGSTFDDGSSYDKDCCESCISDNDKGTAGVTECRDRGTVNKMSCGKFLKTYGKSHCYIPDVFINCCTTCSSLSLSTSACNYGDRDEDRCKKYIATITNGVCDDKYKNLCCHSCRQLATYKQPQATTRRPIAHHPTSYTPATYQVSISIYCIINANILLYFF
ncbi:disintegrin and metalloproteinase domain-containing protein 7 isoform X2 [Patella vulgata]|uniref:disintegrin and metalloproteinase domain-containing protein 7 isoform X2 n=1 Tax=Patella vulgata TaxID=6465 RepID=UPI00217F78C0|nr:disintegrin and metalloproteinase domain-containing protein 7 isoform X2 [Patella vulgata]